MKKVKKPKISVTKSATSSKGESIQNFDFSNIESQFESFVLKNLPALPQNAINVLVQVAPWLAIIGVITGIPAIMTLLGMSRIASYYRLAGMSLGLGYQVSNLLMIVQMILTGLSIQGLFARKISAWRLMYYAAWVSILANLLNGGVVSMLIGGLISFYLLFQVKKAYK